jgi:hypothetical protein
MHNYNISFDNDYECNAIARVSYRSLIPYDLPKILTISRKG